MGISGFRVVSHVWNYYSGFFSVVSTHILYQLDNFPWFPHERKFGNLGWGFHIVSKARELSTSRFPRFPEFGKHGKHMYWFFRLDSRIRNLPTFDFCQISQHGNHLWQVIFFFLNIFINHTKQLLLFSLTLLSHSWLNRDFYARNFIHVKIYLKQ